MRVLAQSNTLSELQKQISEQYTCDYVYMYPPRQAYRPFEDQELSHLISSSLDKFDGLNLYLHFPFCRQICAFCNLFTHVSLDEESFNRYVGYLEREIEYYLPWIRGKKINTLYLGGGTPSLLPPEMFERLFHFLSRYLNCNIRAIPEVAIEVSPETVEREKFVAYKEVGINRVNLGVQSFADHELHAIGRGYDPQVPFRALQIVQEIGFNNVCVDLIYGLEGQTFCDWQKSVQGALRYAPETICAYALTLRPVTGFDKKGYRSISNGEQYAKYDYIHDTLLKHGYWQETHVRWVRNENGGYLQKANHWALENLLGLGAGARSYLWHIDARNGYSVRHRNQAYNSYFHRLNGDNHAVVDGFVMNGEERMRKAVVLGLINLDRLRFTQLFGVDPITAFPSEFHMLFDLGLAVEGPNYVKLTEKGVRHRDVIVQRFFSEHVKKLLETFEYNE